MGRRGRGRGRDRGRGGFDQDQQRSNQDQQPWRGNGNQRGQPGQNNPSIQGGTTPWSRQHPNQKHQHNQKSPNHQFDQHQDHFPSRNHQFDQHQNHHPSRNHQFDQHQNHHPSQDQVQKTIQCDRCEKIGHTESACTAKEIPFGSRCSCGSAFHYLTQCPYQGDVFKRDEEKAAKEGKLCTWCKDTGDGRHTFDDCNKANEFRLDLFRIQRDAYDDLEFCWHCGRVDHRTKACTGAQTRLDKDLWAAKISEVMEEWNKYSNATVRAAYFDNEWDQRMSDVRDRRSPPLAAYCRWCIMCEVFGHATGEKIEGCNAAKFDSRCPVERRIQVTGARPFVPRGFQAPSAQVNNVRVPHDTRYAICSTAGCNQMVGPWTWPMPAMGEFLPCPNCSTLQAHPGLQQPLQSSQIDLLRGIGHLIGAALAAPHGGDKPRARLTAEQQEMYLKRPSLKLPWSLAHHQKLGNAGIHDAHSHRYTDGSRQGAWSPILWEDGRYFNADWQGGGNYQEYFPAITFQITPSMRADSDNAALPINRVGRQGLMPKCTGCQAPILVLDDEDDVVMCDTAWTNTLGEGAGKGFYRRADGTYHPNQCECLWMIGQRGVVGWEDRRTGEWVR